MVDLLTKGTKFKWEDSHELAFKTLKQAITSDPVLAFPNLKEKFLLFCDASNSCLGAMLAQEVDKTLKPLGYFSRKLNATEQLWVICDKELLSIILALKHWYGLLKHAEVIVYTDSLSAKYIASSDKQTSSRRAKLVANLALFDKVRIIHIPGDKIPWQISYHKFMILLSKRRKNWTTSHSKKEKPELPRRKTE